MEHQSKPEIALKIVERAVSSEIEHGCVVADRFFGEARNFRWKLQAISEPYVMEVLPAEFRVVHEDTDLIHPDAHPSRKHAAHPEDVTSETPAEVAECLGDDA
nr:transposase [Natrinema gelatinilyticum]